MSIDQDEINILSSAILNADVCDHVVSFLDSQDFPTKEYGKVLEAIKFLQSESKIVNLPNLVYYAKKFNYDPNSPINLSTGVNYSLDIVDELMKNLKLHHAIKKLDNELPLVLKDKEFSYDNYQEKLLSFIESLDTENKIAKVKTIKEKLHHYDGDKPFMNYIKELVDNFQKTGKPPGIMTGFERLDEIIKFIPTYGYILVGAKTSVGKTSFSMGLLKQFMKQGKKCAILSFEMDDKSLLHKYLSLITCIPVEKFKIGNLTSEEICKIEAVQNLQEHKNLFIQDTFSPNIETVLHKIRKLKRIHGVDVIMIDYLTKIKGPAHLQSKHLEIDYVSKSLQRIALQENVILLTLAQFNRQSSNDQRAPTLGDFRESGSIEEDADICFLLHRPIVHIKPPPNISEYELEKWKDDAKLLRVYVAKNRVIGNLGAVKFDYNLEKGWHEIEHVDELEEEKRNIRIEELKRKEEARQIDQSYMQKFNRFTQ